MHKPIDYPAEFQAVDAWLDAHFNELKQELKALVAAPSVKDSKSARPGAPFGEGTAEALRLGLALAEKLGFATENVDGYCGVADLPGSAQTQIGILAHLDVVPAIATDWQHPPFAPEEVDGRIFGRGTIDDKGPLVAALYAGAALKACGLSLTETVRYIMGCDEEDGMECVRYYLEKYPQPGRGFTPDGDFPAIIGEMGILHFTCEASWDAAGENRLLALTAGTAANVVPAAAEAVFSGRLTLPAPGPGLTILEEEGCTRLRASGTAAHASTPVEGKNALTTLLQYLEEVAFAPVGAKQYLHQLFLLTTDDCFGQSFGIAAQDARSRLTCAPTILQLDETGGRLVCDVRFPVTHQSETYLPRLRERVAAAGLQFTLLSMEDPLWLGEEDPLAETLVSVYRDLTGDLREPEVIGGGTYAKTMQNFLAFGPEMPDEPKRAHLEDEFVTCDELMQMARIYARAIWQLAK